MSIFKKKENYQVTQQWKIKRRTLDFILESAKSTYPNEFGGFLRVDLDKKDTISEIVLLPGTVSGESHAIFKLNMLPIDFSIVGTVHSHPSVSFLPSEADTFLFRKYGKIHMIVAYPFNPSSWKAYDLYGKKTDVKII
jgi:proteasome lid subunit RPN8/RPN11